MLRAELALSAASLPGIEITVQEIPYYGCREGRRVCIFTCTHSSVLPARLGLGRIKSWALVGRRQSGKALGPPFGGHLEFLLVGW